MRLTKASCLLYGASFLLTSATGSSTINNGTFAVGQPDGQQIPTAVRKMSDDEGEKFFFNYWGFDSGTDEVNSFLSSRNVIVSDLRPPILVHTSKSARRALSMLWGRDFKCPTDTFSCSSIGQSSSCCSDGDSCVIVQNTGLGVVGCCPDGETCGETVGACENGYTSCPSSIGGGCCIPGYECVTGGCKYSSGRRPRFC